MTNLPDNPDTFTDENGQLENIWGEPVTADELQRRLLAKREPEPREDV